MAGRSSTRAKLAWSLVALVCAVIGQQHAHADPGPRAQNTNIDIDIDNLWQRVLERLDRASDTLEPPLQPPSPRPAHWQARRISSVDLGAPFLALASGDLDGDGRAEIIGLTTEELVLIERRGRRELQVRARIQLPGRAAAIRPRHPVGTLVVADIDGDNVLDVLARSSERHEGAVFGLRDNALVEISRFSGFPLCAGVSAELELGRNYFEAVNLAETPAGISTKTPAKAPADRPADPGAKNPAPVAAPGGAVRMAFADDKPRRFFSARCRDDMVDAVGRKLGVAAILGNDGTLAVWSERLCPRRDAACHEQPMASRSLADNGAVFELADIDRDGHPEIIVTAATPPGEPDRVTVLSWRGARLEDVFQRAFSGGVVGLSAGDIDGDHVLDLLAAVRLWGSHRIDLWVFNR